MQLDDIYGQAIAKWGKVLQLVMALEETAELQKEVCKVIRGDWSGMRMNSLASEIADVEIMCGQLRFMCKLDSKVEAEKRLKLARIEKMLTQREATNSCEAMAMD